MLSCKVISDHKNSCAQLSCSQASQSATSVSLTSASAATSSSVPSVTGALGTLFTANKLPIVTQNESSIKITSSSGHRVRLSNTT